MKKRAFFKRKCLKTDNDNHANIRTTLKPDVLVAYIRKFKAKCNIIFEARVAQRKVKIPKWFKIVLK